MQIYDIEDFRRCITSFRKAKGRGALTELANASGYSQTTLGRIEKGEYNSVKREQWRKLHEFSPDFFPPPPEDNTQPSAKYVALGHELTGLWRELEAGLNDVVYSSLARGRSVHDCVQRIRSFLDGFLEHADEVQKS